MVPQKDSRTTSYGEEDRTWGQSDGGLWARAEHPLPFQFYKNLINEKHERSGTVGCDSSCWVTLKPRTPIESKVAKLSCTIVSFFFHSNIIKEYNSGNSRLTKKNFNNNLSINLMRVKLKPRYFFFFTGNMGSVTSTSSGAHRKIRFRSWSGLARGKGLFHNGCRTAWETWPIGGWHREDFRGEVLHESVEQCAQVTQLVLHHAVTWFLKRTNGGGPSRKTTPASPFNDRRRPDMLSTSTGDKIARLMYLGAASEVTILT